MLGFDRDAGVFYEGVSNYGTALQQSPIVYPMNLILDPDQIIEGLDSQYLNSSQYIFREISFDPVSNVRRGHCYRGNDSQPTQWYLRKDPHQNDGKHKGEISLVTFHQQNISHKLKQAILSQPLVCIGSTENFTIGVITAVETTITGREIVSLKMRQMFGVFPSMIKNHPDSEGSLKIEAQLQKVKDSYYNSLPESVIDRCRDAASEILGVYLNEPKKDLHKQIQALQNKDTKNKKRVAEAAADIIRLFHSRAKPSMIAKLDPKPPEIAEQDAELAVQCLGVMLRDLGYATWQVG